MRLCALMRVVSASTDIYIMRKIKQYTQYLAILVPLAILKRLPLGCLKVLASLGAQAAYYFPGMGSLISANIRTVFPGWTPRQVRKVGKASLKHLFWNMLEFFWINGDSRRIRRRYLMPEDLRQYMIGQRDKHIAMIMVNTHLGSWEASGVMAPYYFENPMVAVAKPIHNPYINNLFNRQIRQMVPGFEVVFTKGAVKASISALKAGKNLGILVDQNTRVRDGGVWVDLFGLPVPGSASPALLKRYCDQHNIAADIICGVSIRQDDGTLTVKTAQLPKPFAEYADDREVLQDLMKISESFIRQYPEQYLWLYRRFAYIPPDCPEELKKRYPAYARVPNDHFFSKRRKK